VRDSAARPQELRCAIYTRKSSEEGLEQDFNSLHAQREACQAYIKSQKHEGWRALSAHYDDGGYSGGSMERPALQRLLADIKSRRIDVVVVYKVDRLTRSLADFAKIVEVFDASGVSFVSVTQAFNTTTSMGRLTLNVLLSFAQFEREVTGERIRDKIAASKKKGLWMGGFVPFGYRAKDRTLVIDEKEAATVRLIFRRYLELGAVSSLETDIAERNLRTRAFTSANSNRAWGDRPFSRGHLYKMLSNPIYAGKIAHKEKLYDGQHDGIIDRKTFAAVQAQLAANNRKNRTQARAKEPNLLAGLLVDRDGNRLTSSHAVKNGKRYRYYIGTRSEQGEIKAWRLPAGQIETAVINELQRFLGDRQRIATAMASQRLSAHQLMASRRLSAHQLKEALWNAKQLETQMEAAATRREAVHRMVSRVLVSDTELNVEVKLSAVLPEGAAPARGVPHRLKMPIELIRRNGETAVVVAGDSRHATKPDPVLVKAIARGITWFEQLAFGRVETVSAIAKRERVTDRYVSRMIELAFLSPRIVEAAVSGVAKIKVSTKKLVLGLELPPFWMQQEGTLLARLP
jgi:DNA invertase Pin-like site-specific DNA recombinase